MLSETFFAPNALAPTASSYGAIVSTLVGMHGFFAALLTIMALFTVARWWTGRLGAARRVVFDNTRLMWHYAVAQSLGGLALVHGFPRLVG